MTTKAKASNVLEEPEQGSSELLPRIEVDYINKTLIVPKDVDTIGVVGDNNSRRIYFKLKRYQDDMDLAKGVLTVAFTNADKKSGMYVVDDMTHDDNWVLFSFLIPKELTPVAGAVYVGICGSAPNDVHWHVQPYKFTIGKFITITELEDTDPTYMLLNRLIYETEQACKDVRWLCDNAHTLIDYDELSNWIDIPTKVSQLENDKKYQSDKDVEAMMEPISITELNLIWEMV